MIVATLATRHRRESHDVQPDARGAVASAALSGAEPDRDDPGRRAQCRQHRRHAGQELLGIEERSRSFEQVSTIDPPDTNLEYEGEIEHAAAASVSDDFLPLLGVRPALGRLLDSRIDAGAQHPLAILISDELVAPPVCRRSRGDRESPCASTMSRRRSPVCWLPVFDCFCRLP